MAQSPNGRLLLVTQKSPFPPDSGSRQRSWLLVEALREIGPVDIAVIGGTRPAVESGGIAGVVVHWLGGASGDRPSSRMSRRLHELTQPFGKSARLAANLGALLRDGTYRTVLFRYLSTFALVEDACRGIPTVVDIDDLDTQKLRSEMRLSHAGASRRLWAALRLLFVARDMRRVARRSGLRLFCTLEDAAEMRLPDYEIVPNIPISLARGRPPAPQPSATYPPVIKFLGRLSWDVNIRGLDGFIHEAWPQIRTFCPEACLEVGGSDLREQERRRWAAVPGVSVAGLVDDVGAFYRTASFTICPIFEGGGTKIKVLESLWHGRAVVITPHSHRGYETILPGGHGVAIGRNWPELARHCVRLLTDHRARHEEEAEGHRRVVAGLDWAHYAGTVRRAVARAERILKPMPNS